MPQLWTETIVTQYFWLVVILFGFYYLAVTMFIPQIAYTIKARKTLTESSALTRGQAVLGEDAKKEDVLLNNTKTLLSSILTPKIPTPKSNTTDELIANINTVKTNWINKHA